MWLFAARAGDGRAAVRLLDVTALPGAAAAEERASRALATAAHELRAPLVGVAGLLQCVRTQGLDPMTADAIVTSAARVESLCVVCMCVCVCVCVCVRPSVYACACLPMCAC